MSLIPIAYLDVALVELHERHPAALLRAWMLLRLALIFLEDAIIKCFGCLITRKRADITDSIPRSLIVL